MGDRTGRDHGWTANVAAAISREFGIPLDKKKKHTIEIVIDRVSIDPSDRARLTDSVEAAVKAGAGSIIVAVEGEPRERAYSEARACPSCGTYRGRQVIEGKEAP